MKKYRALVACEESQAVTIELRKRGWDAYSCDIQECSGGHPEWHICEDNPDCEWLGETSSDEMTGHYFAYGIYFDLVADKKEKKKIAEVVKTITDHIIENNFYIR